ncbi:MAG: hypothetical protein ACOY82_07980 [Pseudomonadota bacterium]
MRAPNFRAGIAPPSEAPLHAALDYRARRLQATLDDFLPRSAIRAGFAPTTATLLHWWFSTDATRLRVDNFNPMQRQALLHVLIACELLRSDDPARLFRRACEPPGRVVDDAVPAEARYRLRLAPGSGPRWVIQALLVWRWALSTKDEREDMSADAGDLRLSLIVPSPGLGERLRTALSGSRDRTGDEGSLLRHARLFLPPSWRTPFREWLRGAPDDALRVDIDMQPGPLRLIANRGAERLQIEILEAEAAATHDAATAPATLVEATLTDAVRCGACKLPVLAWLPMPQAPLRAEPLRRPGLRPKLSRMHRLQLRAGIDALTQRDAAFVALDPARRPRMLVACATSALQRAARRCLIDAGIASDAIAVAGDASPTAGTRVLLDALPPRAIAGDPRICVVVALRDHRDAVAANGVAAGLAAIGAAALWPEADFAELRHENIERVAMGRPLRHLIDVLTIVDDPRCRRDHPEWPLARPSTQATSATDDLFPASLRAHAAAFDIRLPATPCDGMGPESAPCDVRSPSPESLCDAPARLLRRRHALAVEKSVHTHAHCDNRDGGLRRAFLECAEADPRVESHCLPDPRRHGVRHRESLLARGLDARGWPDALVRTADCVYLVEFLPFCPARARPPTPGECATKDWLDAVGALPAAQRDHRAWRRATLPAPTFWSWKRSGGSLTALLSALADDGTASAPGNVRRHRHG